MAETSYPVAGGGSVTDYRYEMLMAEVGGAGMVGVATVTQLMYADSTGRQIKLKPFRRAFIRGFRWETDGAGLTAPVTANTSGFPRLDLGVLRLDRSTYDVRFAIKQGTPAANPVAPAATQNDDVDGVWELPVGTVKVVSTTTGEAASGLPSIAAADVTPLDYFLAPPPIVCHSTRMPPVRASQMVTQYDKGRVLVGLGSTYHLIGENGPEVKLAVKSGFDQADVYVTRRNGFVHMRALLYRNSPTSTPAGTDIVLFNLPADYRPPDGYIAYMAGSHHEEYARFYANGDTGDVGVLSYASPLTDNQSFTIHPATWPARY